METDRGGRGIGAAIALFVVVAIALALFVKGLYPADLPKSRDPDFVDNVFANRAVVLSARMLLISAAAVLAFGGEPLSPTRKKSPRWNYAYNSPLS